MAAVGEGGAQRDDQEAHLTCSRDQQNILLRRGDKRSIIAAMREANDRLDHRLGSPLNAVVLASSEGHDRKNFVVVHEERLGFTTTIPGQTLEQLIRADMTYIEKPAGGAVFSVGSITYCGSLPHNKFDNDVSRLTFNVLNRFGELGLKWPFGPAKA